MGLSDTVTSATLGTTAGATETKRAHVSEEVAEQVRSLMELLQYPDNKILTLEEKGRGALPVAKSGVRKDQLYLSVLENVVEGRVPIITVGYLQEISAASGGLDDHLRETDDQRRITIGSQYASHQVISFPHDRIIILPKGTLTEGTQPLFEILKSYFEKFPADFLRDLISRFKRLSLEAARRALQISNFSLREVIASTKKQITELLDASKPHDEKIMLLMESLSQQYADLLRFSPEEDHQKIALQERAYWHLFVGDKGRKISIQTLKAINTLLSSGSLKISA